MVLARIPARRLHIMAHHALSCTPRSNGGMQEVGRAYAPPLLARTRTKALSAAASRRARSSDCAGRSRSKRHNMSRMRSFASRAFSRRFLSNGVSITCLDACLHTCSNANKSLFPSQSPESKTKESKRSVCFSNIAYAWSTLSLFHVLLFFLNVLHIKRRPSCFIGRV